LYDRCAVEALRATSLQMGVEQEEDFNFLSAQFLFNGKVYDVN
jgi:hypothetical protein